MNTNIKVSLVLSRLQTTHGIKLEQISRRVKQLSMPTIEVEFFMFLYRYA